MATTITNKWRTKLFVEKVDHAVVVYLTNFKPTTDQLVKWIINHGNETEQEVVDFSVTQVS